MLLALLAGCAGPPAGLGREYTSATPILDGTGGVWAAGWARHPLFVFDPAAVPADQASRIRQWDFYAVYTPDFEIETTLAGISIGDDPLLLGSLAVHDYRDGVDRGPSFLALGAELAFEPAPGGAYDAEFSNGTVDYAIDGDQRVISVDAGDDSAHLVLDPPDDESMALVTPFGGRGQFFYEDKVIPLAATGEADVAGLHYDLPAGGSYGVLDFARGVMPETVHWTWATAAGELGGRRVGLNLGSVFGDERGGTPDAVIVDGRLNKLPPVNWSYDLDDLLAPWTFRSDDGRVDLALTADRGHVDRTSTDLGVYSVDLWKIHGSWTGTVGLDDGSVLPMDGLIGAAEVLDTRW